MSILSVHRRGSSFLRRVALGASLAAAASAFALEAHAQGNYQSALLGGRSAIMGGTGVALGVDGAAPYLNPANLTLIEDRQLAFSSRFFRYSQRSFEGWRAPGAVDASIFGDVRLDPMEDSESELDVVPDATCFFIDWVRRKGGGRIGRAAAGSRKLAWCIGKTEENAFSIDALNLAVDSGGRRVNQAQSLNREWTSWSVGPAFALSVTDDLTIGGAIYVSRSGHTSAVSVGTIVESGPAGAVGALYQLTSAGYSWDAVALLGANYKLSDTYSAGVSVRTPNVHIYDDFGASYSDVLDNAAGSMRYWAGDGSLVIRSPARFAVGLGAEWSRLRIELDAFLYTGLDNRARADVDREALTLEGGVVTRRAREQVSLVEGAMPVANVGLGAEVFVTSSLSILAGVLTDFSGLRPLAGADPYASRLFHDRMDALRTGLGVASYTDYGDLVLGARADFAWGEMGAVNAFVSPARIEPVDYTAFEVTLVLAGRISLRAVTDAARQIGEAVDGKTKEPVTRPTQPMSKPRKKEKE